jgi:predicted dehydrogenase/threonine dehydrogenase-like Zn-dependent dehydrogenase
MKQVVEIPRTGEIQVVDVPPPRLRPGGALVLTRASIISPGTEGSKIALGQSSLVGKARARPDLARQVVERVRQEGLRETYRTVHNRLTTPAPLGYSSCGVVLETAPDCQVIARGDVVACAGGGYANHAEVNFVPRNLLARVPEGVTAAQAAYGTIGAIALHSVRRANVSIGSSVAVVGLGLVGLLVMQIVRAAGGRVLATDPDSAVCDVARELGADRVVEGDDSIESISASLTEGHGVDAAIICAATSSNDPIKLASALCRDRGRVVVVGDVGMHLPRAPFYEKELELGLSRSYGPGRYDSSYEEHGRDYPIGYVRWTEQRNLAEFLRLVGQKLIDVDALTTHRLPVERAADAYALIAGDRSAGERAIGVVLEYPGDPSAASSRRVEIDSSLSAPPRGSVRLGVIGAGSFATRVLLPALAKDERVTFVGVSTASGSTARRVAERFGFAHATSDAEELIGSADLDAVVIATRHDSHAALAARALRAGKTVFCEKPLATTWPDLEEVASAYTEARATLLVGFNRRFSPHIEKLRAELPPGVPRAIICRVNAGPLPSEHWVNDPIAGGGRIVGELCHFLDLACHLAEGRPLRVSAEPLGDGEVSARADSVIVQVAFADGSVASLQYLANGSPKLSKERVEVFSGGVVAVLDDFRSLEILREGTRWGKKSKRQEKGHNEEMRAFVDLVTGTEPILETPEDAFWSSALTLQVPAALGRGGPASVDLPEAFGGKGARVVAAPDAPEDGAFEAR